MKITLPKINDNIKDKLIYLGKNTLGIYIISSLIQPNLLPKITENLSNINYLYTIIQSIIVLLITIIIIEIIKKNKILNKYLLGDK